MKVRDIIEKAIEENRSREKLLVGVCRGICTVGNGCSCLGLANDSLVAYAGVAESVLFVPAILFGAADQSRKCRIAIAREFPCERQRPQTKRRAS